MTQSMSYGTTYYSFYTHGHRTVWERKTKGESVLTNLASDQLYLWLVFVLVDFASLGSTVLMYEADADVNL